MKSLWILSALLIIIGFCVFLYSYAPQTAQEPYLRVVTQTKDNVLVDETISAKYTFCFKSYLFKEGDKISIIASIDEGTLSVSVDEVWSGEIISKEDVQSVNLDVAIQKDSTYTITVERYRTSIFVLYSNATNANVKIAQRTTEQAFATAYRDVITYPYKGYQTAGFAVMVAGIGCGVLSVAQNKNKNNSSFSPLSSFPT